MLSMDFLCTSNIVRSPRVGHTLLQTVLHWSSAAIVTIEAHQCPCDNASLFLLPNNSGLYRVVIRSSTMATDLLAKKAHCTHSQDNNGRRTTSFVTLFHLVFPKRAVYLCFRCTANMVPSSPHPLSTLLNLQLNHARLLPFQWPCLFVAVHLYPS